MILFHSKMEKATLFLVKADDFNRMSKYIYNNYDSYAYLILKDLQSSPKVYIGQSFSNTPRGIDHKGKERISYEDHVLFIALPHSISRIEYENLEKMLINEARSSKFLCENEGYPSKENIEISFNKFYRTNLLLFQKTLSLTKEIFKLLDFFIYKNLESLKTYTMTGNEEVFFELEGQFIVPAGTRLYPEQPSFGRYYKTNLNPRRDNVNQDNVLQSNMIFSSCSASLSFIKGSPRNGLLECTKKTLVI